jgi:hypothetical protein
MNVLRTQGRTLLRLCSVEDLFQLVQTTYPTSEPVNLAHSAKANGHHDKLGIRALNVHLQVLSYTPICAFLAESNLTVY